MKLAVCGKIASGKSEVMKVLGDCGFFCVSADEIVHDLYRKGGKGAARVAEFFGEEFLDKSGSVDRAKLRALVFTDESSLQKLNEAIHPLIKTEMLKRIPGADADVAVESLYFEGGLPGDLVDEVLWVERDESEIRKVLEKRGLNEKEIAGVLGSMMSPEAPDYLIKNDGNLADLEKLVKERLGL